MVSRCISPLSTCLQLLSIDNALDCHVLLVLAGVKFFEVSQHDCLKFGASNACIRCCHISNLWRNSHQTQGPIAAKEVEQCEWNSLVSRDVQDVREFHWISQCIESKLTKNGMPRTSRKLNLCISAYPCGGEGLVFASGASSPSHSST